MQTHSTRPWVNEVRFEASFLISLIEGTCTLLASYLHPDPEEAAGVSISTATDIFWLMRINHLNYRCMLLV